MYLTQMLHRALQQRPDRPMTICGDRVHTTTEVVDRVARLAGALRGLGIGEGDRVGMLSLNSDRYYEFLFASWWTGAVAHPINTRWSSTEINYALDDSGTDVLLVDDTFASTMAELPGVETVVYCGDGPTPSGMLDYEEMIDTATPVEDLRHGNDAVAALLYTGGTTGFPKGVMITHRGLSISAIGTQAVSGNYERGGTTLVATPMFHVAALGGCLSQTSIGGTVVLAPRFEAGEILRTIQRCSVTTTTLPPTMIQTLCEHPEMVATDTSRVRGIIYGASPISESTLTGVMRAFPRAGFAQGYGMTETAMISVLSRADHAQGGPRLRSAGRATPHAEVRIADPAGNELPRGQVGEIVTRGDHIMAGYWNKPELTAQAIQDGWFRTGDLGSMDEDGYIYLVDRLKDMIITGGENVYSTEVENALASHPAVEGCAVIGIPDPRWGERVHALIVLRPGMPATAGEIRSHVKDLIAGYKAPRSVDFLDSLPMTAAGKIDKRRLRENARDALTRHGT
ncbi:fatty-acid--CoA ligase [Rhodococcus sp. SC4]|nr:fatty-acid--CoA ligase [Rhodococcus sp. SC4]